MVWGTTLSYKNQGSISWLFLLRNSVLTARSSVLYTQGTASIETGQTIPAKMLGPPIWNITINIPCVPAQCWLERRRPCNKSQQWKVAWGPNDIWPGLCPSCGVPYWIFPKCMVELVKTDTTCTCIKKKSEMVSVNDTYNFYLKKCCTFCTAKDMWIYSMWYMYWHWYNVLLASNFTNM